MNPNELLIFIFEECLVMEELADLQPPDFAKFVSERFEEEIRARGNLIPEYMKKMLLESLQEEVLTMYRKKTYGFYDLTTYQKHVSEK